MAGLVSSLLAFLTVPALGQDRPAERVLLTDAVKDGAVCLDGTPAGYYIRRGAASTKWHIWHQGGGWCVSLDDCLARTRSHRGSSRMWKPEEPMRSGYSSEDPAVNAMMHDWNMVYLKYCDGGSFSGNNATVTEYKGAKLYFRGKQVLQAMQNDLLSKGLKDATEVVISGGSAGGLAAYLHIDQWAQVLRSASASLTKIVAMPDSGFFLDYENNTEQQRYHSKMLWVFQQMNATSGVNQDCIQAYQATGETWRCIFAQYTAPFIKTPTFALQSTYDTWQMHNELGTGDPTLVNAYGNRLEQTLRDTLLANPANGVFLDSCAHHVEEAPWTDYYADGRSQGQAFMDWYMNGSASLANHGFFRQGQAYPCDACCHPPSELEPAGDEQDHVGSFQI